jgi:small basic protein
VLARRAAWDAIVASIRARLSEAFAPTVHRQPLSPGFIAASLVALGLDQVPAA